MREEERVDMKKTVEVRFVTRRFVDIDLTPEEWEQFEEHGNEMYNNMTPDEWCQVVDTDRARLIFKVMDGVNKWLKEKGKDEHTRSYASLDIDDMPHAGDEDEQDYATAPFGDIYIPE